MKSEKIAWLIEELAEQLSMQVVTNAAQNHKLKQSNNEYGALTRGHGYTKTEIVRTIDLMRSELMQLKRRYK